MIEKNGTPVGIISTKDVMGMSEPILKVRLPVQEDGDKEEDTFQENQSLNRIGFLPEIVQPCPHGPADLPELEARTMRSEVRSSTAVSSSTRSRTRSDELKASAGPDIQKLMRFGIDHKSASSTGKKFFGREEVQYIAIDGTCSIDQHLDLLVFYVGAFGYSGTLRFEVDEIMVGDPSAMSQSSAAVSAAIPLSEEDAATVFGQRTESGTEVKVDSERLPNAVMHLAEYYIALRSVASGGNVKVVLLDRPLAGDVAHLVWSTRDLVQDRLSVLEGMETPSGRVTNFDLELARLLVANPALKIPSSRGASS